MKNGQVLVASLVLLFAACFVVTILREGFVGNVSAADMAEIEADLAARQTSYNQGSRNVSSSPAILRTLVEKVKALCGFQTSACAQAGTTQSCCDGANQLCATATKTLADYKANTPVASQTVARIDALQGEQTMRCDAAKVACAVPAGSPDTACCTASRPGCTGAAIDLAKSQIVPSYVPATTYLDGTKIPKPTMTLAELGIVDKKGYLSKNDADARAYVDDLSRRFPTLGNPLTSLGYVVTDSDNYPGADAVTIQREIMQKVPTTQTSLSPGAASLLSDMPLDDALSQGRRYKGKRTRNGNRVPPPDETYEDDCADAVAEEDIAVRVEEPGSYPFATAHEDNGCD